MYFLLIKNHFNLKILTNKKYVVFLKVKTSYFNINVKFY